MKTDFDAYKAGLRNALDEIRQVKVNLTAHEARLERDIARINHIQGITADLAPDFQAPHNIGERLPNSDTAGSGANPTPRDPLVP